MGEEWNLMFESVSKAPMQRGVWSLILAALLSVLTFAQTPARPEFDAASVKPASGRPQGQSNVFLSGGRYIADAASLRGIIDFAYRPLLPRQIVGGPEWLATTQYSIVAKGPGNPSGETLRLMVRALLEDRFDLRVHTETRDAEAYMLVAARRDGRFGPKLTRSRTDCSKYTDAAVPPDEPPPVVSEVCGFRVTTRNVGGVGVQVVLTAKGVTMEQLVAQLSSTAPVGRVVFDRTGLTGSYDVEISFSAGVSINGNAIDSDQTGVSVFTALQEQLGLKLEPITASVEFLVIDGAEHPIAD